MVVYALQRFRGKVNRLSERIMKPDRLLKADDITLVAKPSATEKCV